MANKTYTLKKTPLKGSWQKTKNLLIYKIHLMLSDFLISNVERDPVETKFCLRDEPKS